MFLPRGEPALTRRAGKYSTLRAVVVRFSRTRKRYERQGVLVEETALARAEQECLADDDVRRRARERAAGRRQDLDAEYVARFAQRLGEIFPGCPADKRRAIRDATTNRFLKTCAIVEQTSEPLARRAAFLRRRAGRGSAVDALVVAFAEPDGTVLTSEPRDLDALAAYADRVSIERI